MIWFQIILKHVEKLLECKFFDVSISILTYKNLDESVREELYTALTDDLNGQLI